MIKNTTKYIKIVYDLRVNCHRDFCKLVVSDFEALSGQGHGDFLSKTCLLSFPCAAGM